MYDVLKDDVKERSLDRVLLKFLNRGYGLKKKDGLVGPVFITNVNSIMLRHHPTVKGFFPNA